jgi:hypothetical protein
VNNLSLFTLSILCAFACLRLGVKSFVFAFSADFSLASAKTTMAIFTRRIYGRQSLHWCHFGGINQASCRAKMSIQRIVPSFPPVISAEVLQNLHKLQFILSNNID